jgi:hypothetical protein
MAKTTDRISAFTLSYNSIYSNVYDSILFRKINNNDNDLIEITANLFLDVNFNKHVEWSIIISFKELIQNKELYLIYLMSELMTSPHFYDYKGNIILHKTKFDNYFLRGYAILINRNDRTNGYIRPHENSTDYITSREINIYEIDKSLNIIDNDNCNNDNISENKLCYRAIDKILKNTIINNHTVQSHIIFLFNRLLETYLKKFEEEINDIYSKFS